MTLLHPERIAEIRRHFDILLELLSEVGGEMESHLIFKADIDDLWAERSRHRELICDLFDYSEGRVERRDDSDAYDILAIVAEVAAERKADVL